MDFSHSAERQLLADMLNRYFSDRYPFERRQDAAWGPLGHSAEHWIDLVDLGVIGSLFAPEWGGYGGSGFDIMVVFERLGRALAVEPLLAQLMTGTAMTAAGGHPWLEPVVSGKVIAAFAHQERAGDDFSAIETRATRDGSGWRLDGEKAVVAHAEAADGLVVSAIAPNGPTLFIVPSQADGLTILGYANLDGGRSGDVRLEGVRLPAEGMIGDEGTAVRLVDAAFAAGLLALSAEALGIMDIVRQRTLDHVRTREQFGRPIGAFQALQHRIVDMHLDIEQTRSSVINTAATFANGAGPERACMVSAMKYTVGRVGALVAEEAIQLHGGIGMTAELPLSHYAKRLVMIGHQLGDADHHLQRFARISILREAG